MTSLIKCGIVVPTLGRRRELLLQCLQSIRSQNNVFICLVSPYQFDSSELIELGLVDEIVIDPVRGLAEAINFGIRSLPDNIDFVNWIGDDDLLNSNSLKASSDILINDPTIGMVFGSCDYVGTSGEKIWRNRSGQWAVPLLRIGPCLIPQPGALFRRDVFNTLGGLDSQFKWAFDYEFFLRLSKKHKIRYVPETLASFRWHSDSLSVGGRKGSVAEASKVRKMHLPKAIRPLSNLWEIPVKMATEYAGYFVSRNAAKLSRRNR
jgi:GT2 family glycosyltransferase